MAHSKVYYDGETYVTLVPHVQFANELRVPQYEDPDGSCLHGLLEYSLFPGEGLLRVYDPDDDEMYEVHTVEDWGGLDKGAVQALLDAVDGVEEVQKTGGEYRRIRSAYRRTGDPVKALAKHKIGTVVRIENGYAWPKGVDIALKTEDNTWVMAGFEDTWEDDEIEEFTYEVIYSV